MTPERHLCILHGGAADLWPQCAPLLEDVADDRLKWLYLADAHGQGDVRYRYYVRAYDAVGRTSPPSNTVTVALPLPRYDGRP